MKPAKYRGAFNHMESRIRSQFPDIPEAQLCCSVVVQALRDLFYPNNAGIEKENIQSNYETALNYLAGDIPHADIWGVEADWIRHLIYSMRVADDTRNQSRWIDHAKRTKGKAGRSRLLAQAVGYTGEKRPAASRVS